MNPTRNLLPILAGLVFLLMVMPDPAMAQVSGADVRTLFTDLRTWLMVFVPLIAVIVLILLFVFWAYFRMIELDWFVRFSVGTVGIGMASAIVGVLMPGATF